MVDISEFFTNLPNFTKYFIFGAMGLAVMTSLKLWNHEHAYFIVPDKLYRVWTYLLSPLFMGGLQMNLFFSLYFFAIMCGKLEMDFQGKRYSDFIYLLVVVFGLSFVISIIWYWGSAFCIHRAIAMSIYYIFCKRNPNEQIMLFFVFTIKASYFPFAEAVMDFLFGGNFINSCIGIIAGHIYVYLKDVYTVARGVDYLRTPNWFERLYFKTNRIAQGGIPQNNGENRGDQRFRIFRGQGVRIG